MNEQWIVDRERYKAAHKEWQSTSGQERLSLYLAWAGLILFVGGAIFGVGSDDGENPVVVASIGALVGLAGFVWRMTLKETSSKAWAEMDAISKRFQSRGYHIQHNGELTRIAHHF